MREYKKKKGDPKGRKYKCPNCESFVFIEGRKLEIDERVYCNEHKPKTF